MPFVLSPTNHYNNRVLHMEEISRWSSDSDELVSCLPSQPLTPGSVRTLLRSRGSPFRTLGKKLGLAGLRSPGGGEAMSPTRQSHVVGEGAAVLHTKASYLPLRMALGGSFEREVTRALDFVQESLSATNPPPPTMRPRQDDEKTIGPARPFIMSSPSSSPPENANYGPLNVPRQRVITGEFRELQRLSPPDLSQHPMNQEFPLSSTSNAPLMITNSKREEIKNLVKDARRKFDDNERQRQHEEAEQAEAERQGTVRFKSFPKRSIAFNTGYNNAVGHQASSFTFEGAMASKSKTSERPPTFSRQTPRHASDPVRSLNLRSNFSRLQIDKDNEETDIYDILKEGSPTIASTPHQSKNSLDSGKGTTTPASDGYDQKKSGLRKVTGRFGKSKSERLDSEFTPPVDAETLHRPDLERYLRNTTNNPSHDYDPGQPYPRHPNTSRGWYSRNLKCTTCLDEGCAVCGRSCCAYRAAALALNIHRFNPDSLKVAEERLMQIAYLYPYGQEVPTFLQCTKGDEIGCGKMVCPDCCGECPNPICKDIQCRKCKKDPWSDCLWHDEDMNRRAF